MPKRKITCTKMSMAIYYSPYKQASHCDYQFPLVQSTL